MNPMLINPKIESDKPIMEQLMQMKSYLRQFKDEVEMILSNIGTENLSQEISEEITEGLTKTVQNAEGISRLSQTATMIKAEVKDVSGSVSRLTLTVDGLVTEVIDPETGESRIAQNAALIQAEVTRATTAEGTLSSRITQTADSISSEVTRATTAEGTLSSRITQNANSISSEVTRATTAEGALSSRITQNADSISSEVTRATTAEGTLSSRITQTADSISSEVTRATGAESSLSTSISQSAHSISLSVSGTASKNTGASITITLKDANGNSIGSDSGTVKIDGNVIFSSQLTDGTTQISGGNILTGTISADRIAAHSLDVAKLTGSVADSGNTWGINFQTGVMTIGNISADKITTGALTVKDSSNNIIFNADKDSKAVTVGGFSVGKDTLESYSSSSNNRSFYLRAVGYTSGISTAKICFATGYRYHESGGEPSDPITYIKSDGTGKIGGLTIGTNTARIDAASNHSSYRGVYLQGDAASTEVLIASGYTYNTITDATFTVKGDGTVYCKKLKDNNYALTILWKKLSNVGSNEYVLTGS